jgi:hypothetical protein
MRQLYRFFRSAIAFARHRVWADAGAWSAADALALAAFFESPAGARLRVFLAASIVRQQSYALGHRKSEDLQYEAGFCAGQKGAATTLEWLADHTKFTEQGDTEADPATNQEAS